MNLTDEQLRVALKALRSQAVQNLMGAEEWDLTEAEELLLWTVIAPERTPIMLVSAADFAQIQAVIDAPPKPVKALIDLFKGADPEWNESDGR